MLYIISVSYSLVANYSAVIFNVYLVSVSANSNGTANAATTNLFPSVTRLFGSDGKQCPWTNIELATVPPGIFAILTSEGLNLYN